MTIVYLRAVKVFNKTTGAFNSQNFIEKILGEKGFQCKTVLIFPIFEWIILLLRFNLRTSSTVHLIAVDFHNGYYHKIVRFINYLILKSWLSKNIDLKTIILDALLPTTRLINKYKYISIIRSSPQCLVFSGMDGRRDHLLKSQLQWSTAIVCASPDAVDSWKAYGYLHGKTILPLPVPIPAILDHSHEETDTTIDNFLEEDDDILNVVVFGGNLGPRKALIPLFDELSKLDVTNFRVKVFGAYDQSTEDLSLSYDFKIDLLGYQKVDFLSPSNKNVIRLYPALSECMSPIQLQGLFSGDRTMIYRRGMEPLLNEWTGDNVVFDSFLEISEHIKENKYSFRSGPMNKTFMEQYKAMFENNIDSLEDYAKHL